jgi:dienelactone hydrolase
MYDNWVRKVSVFTVITLFICINIIPSINSEDKTFYIGNYLDIYPPDDFGPYHIGYFRIRYNMDPFGTYSATIRYPTTRDGWFAPKDTSASPYPGILVGNGFAGSDWNIKWIPKHLTSHGYVTLCFTPPNKLLGNTSQWAYGFIGGIEKLKSLNNNKFSPLYGILNEDIFGAIGLSMGGAGCIEATGVLDSMIDAAVALAAASSNSSISAATNISVPVQIQVGSNDGMVPPHRVLPYYDDFIPDTTVKEYLAIKGGNHIGFIDERVASFAEWIGIDNPRGIEFKEQHRISSKFFTAWFKYYLNGSSDYYTYIFGNEAQNDFDTEILSDFKYKIQ